MLFHVQFFRHPCLCDELISGADRAKKRDLVLEMLRSQILANLENPMQILNIIRTLNECHKNQKVIHMIRQSLDKVVLSGIPLVPGDLHAISTVVSVCRHISVMRLDDCKLDKHSIKILLDGLNGSDVEVRYLYCRPISYRTTGMSVQ